jgi:MFS family permease
MNPESPVVLRAEILASRYKWTVVGMLWFICFFNYADRQAISVILPVLKTQYGFNKEELGRIGAIFGLVYGMSAPFAGAAGDRYARKTLILGGLYIWSAVTGLTALCSKVMQFVLVRGVEGVGEAFYFPASMSLISDYHALATRSRAMSLHQTGVYAGTIGGSALAGWMAQAHGWRTPFVVFAIAGILLGLVLTTFLREPLRNAAERAEMKRPPSPVLGGGAGGGGDVQDSVPQVPMSQFLRELLRTPTALTLLLAFFGANSVALVFLTWMPSFLNEKYKLNLFQSALGATLFIQVASMIGATFGGVLADRWRRRRPGGRILTQALGALLGAPFIFLCGYTRNMSVLVGAMTLFGLCKGLYDSNIWASLYDVIPASRRGAAVGLMNMVAWGGGSLGPYIIGVVMQHGITMSVAIASTAWLYTLVAALLLIGANVFAPRDIASTDSSRA